MNCTVHFLLDKQRWKPLIGWFPQTWLSYLQLWGKKAASDAAWEQEKGFLTADCRVERYFFATVLFVFVLKCITFSIWQKSFICLDIPADSVCVNYQRRQSASAPTTSDSSAQTFKERLPPGGSGSDVGRCKATRVSICLLLCHGVRVACSCECACRVYWLVCAL